MVVGVIDIAGGIEYEAFGAAALFAESIDITFVIISIRKQFFVVAEVVAAYAFSGGVGFKTSTTPAKGLRIFLCYKVSRENSVSMYVKGYVISGCIAATRFYKRLRCDRFGGDDLRRCRLGLYGRLRCGSRCFC